jgi:hypothetical protein
MRVRIEESDFSVTMEHLASESTHRFGLHTPDIGALIADYIVPCLVAVGFSHETIYDAMEEMTYDRRQGKEEEVPDLPSAIHADEYPEYRMLSGMCGSEGSAGQDKGKPEAEA